MKALFPCQLEGEYGSASEDFEQNRLDSSIESGGSPGELFFARFPRQIGTLQWTAKGGTPVGTLVSTVFFDMHAWVQVCPKMRAPFPRPKRGPAL